MIDIFLSMCILLVYFCIILQLENVIVQDRVKKILMKQRKDHVNVARKSEGIKKSMLDKAVKEKIEEICRNCFIQAQQEQ
jgi:hypothetical protein